MVKSLTLVHVGQEIDFANGGFVLDRAGSIRFTMPDDSVINFDTLPPARVHPFPVKRIERTTACQVYLVPLVE